MSFVYNIETLIKNLQKSKTFFLVLSARQKYLQVLVLDLTTSHNLFFGCKKALIEPPIDELYIWDDTMGLIIRSIVRKQSKLLYYNWNNCLAWSKVIVIITIGRAQGE